VLATWARSVSVEPDGASCAVLAMRADGAGRHPSGGATMTRADDMTAAAFVTGAMIGACCRIAPTRGHDPTVITFDVPGMGRVRVHVEAVHIHTTQETRHGSNEYEA
jgi:hypothetical protein